jgi:hypothetical protein
MAEIQTSEVNTKLASVSLGLSRVNLGKNGNQTIVVCQFKPHLWNTGGSISDIVTSYNFPLK